MVGVTAVRLQGVARRAMPDCRRASRCAGYEDVTRYMLWKIGGMVVKPGIPPGENTGVNDAAAGAGDLDVRALGLPP